LGLKDIDILEIEKPYKEDSFDEFMDNIENFDLSNYSRYFVSIK